LYIPNFGGLSDFSPTIQGFIKDIFDQYRGFVCFFPQRSTPGRKEKRVDGQPLINLKDKPTVGKRKEQINPRY